MYLYAIEDTNTGLLVTKHHKLAPLGIKTKLFETKTKAMAAIQGYDFEGHTKSYLLNDLIWNELEQVHNDNRFNIDVSNEEFKEIRKTFNLKVVEVFLGQVEEVGEE